MKLKNRTEKLFLYISYHNKYFRIIFLKSLLNRRSLSLIHPIHISIFIRLLSFCCSLLVCFFLLNTDFLNTDEKYNVHLFWCVCWIHQALTYRAIYRFEISFIFLAPFSWFYQEALIAGFL